MKIRFIALLSCLWAAAAIAAENPTCLPDLTQNNAVDRSQTYNLGATGLRGWIYTKTPRLLTISIATKAGLPLPAARFSSLMSGKIACGRFRESG